MQNTTLDKVMTKKEMLETAKELLEELEWEYDSIGIRYEDRDLNIGDEVGCSKHNEDREDEREFPEYGTEEYEEMYELDGASSWGEHAWEYELLGNGKRYADEPANKRVQTKHAYLIAGGQSSENHDELVLDEGEVVVTDATVIYKFF